MKDCNGVEIKEGDRIEVKEDSRKWPEKYIVSKRNGELGFIDFLTFVPLCSVIGTIRVVGVKR